MDIAEVNYSHFSPTFFGNIYIQFVPRITMALVRNSDAFNKSFNIHSICYDFKNLYLNFQLYICDTGQDKFMRPFSKLIREIKPKEESYQIYVKALLD